MAALCEINSEIKIRNPNFEIRNLKVIPQHSSLATRSSPDALRSEIRDSRCAISRIIPYPESRISALVPRHSANEKICFQSSFMLMTVQLFFFASSYNAWVKVPTLVLGSPCAGP